MRNVRLVLVGIVAATALAGAAAPEPDLVARLDGYTSWGKVNAEPFKMAPAVSVLCAAPATQLANPHDAYIDVYVNDAGREAMLSATPEVFPVGTIIVKEKRTDVSAASPELLTVMIKREAGYNPEVGDWEFAVMDGAARTVRESGRIESCMSCHVTQKAADFVYRPYVSRAS